ncbi:hypothetical protein [Desulfocurvibacter africanus]|nr:hypothetical protein [Desulfocurvibacter africanus]
MANSIRRHRRAISAVSEAEAAGAKNSETLPEILADKFILDGLRC